jgi:TRAP-type C4-dicarboxylate transport system permease small subunit
MATEAPLERLRRSLHHTENGLLVVAVLAMVILAALQIILRNLLGSGQIWIEPLLRSLVLWIGLLGAVTASRDGSHIAIDILTRALPDQWRRGLQVAACSFTVLVCAAITWHGIRYVLLEYEFAGTAFADVPTWAVVTILPLAFGLIGLRYALFAVAFLRGRDPFGRPES